MAAAAVWSPVSILVMATLRNRWPVGEGEAAMVVLFGGALVLVLAVLMVAGRLRPQDLGLRLRDLGPGVAVLLVAWVVLQLLLLPAMVGGAMWVGMSLGTLTALAGQWVGPALFEEVLYRGFFFVQVAQRPLRGAAPGTRGHFLQAAVASGLLFSLAHLPGLVFGDASAVSALGMLAVTAVAGVYGAWLYVRTRNLFVVIGLHALHNAPVPVVDVADGVAGALTMVIGLAIGWAWPRVHRVWRDRTHGLVELPAPNA